MGEGEMQQEGRRGTAGTGQARAQFLKPLAIGYARLSWCVSSWVRKDHTKPLNMAIAPLVGLGSYGCR